MLSREHVCVSGLTPVFEASASKHRPLAHYDTLKGKMRVKRGNTSFAGRKSKILWDTKFYYQQIYAASDDSLRNLHCDAMQ